MRNEYENGFIGLSTVVVGALLVLAVGVGGYVVISKYTEFGVDEYSAFENSHNVDDQLDETLDTKSITGQVANQDHNIEKSDSNETQNRLIENEVSSGIINVQTNIPVSSDMDNQQIETPVDFRAKCELSRERMNVGQKVKAEINISFESRSDFDFEWSQQNLVYSDKHEAVYEIWTPGEMQFIAEVIRKSDGHSKEVYCNINVYEDDEAPEDDEVSYAEQRSGELEDEITDIITKEYARLIYRKLYSWSIEDRSDFQFLIDEYKVYNSSFNSPAYNNPDNLEKFINYWEAWISMKYNEQFTVPYQKWEASML